MVRPLAIMSEIEIIEQLGGRLDMSKENDYAAMRENRHFAFSASQFDTRYARWATEVDHRIFHICMLEEYLQQDHLPSAAFRFRDLIWCIRNILAHLATYAAQLFPSVDAAPPDSSTSLVFGTGSDVTLGGLGEKKSRVLSYFTEAFPSLQEHCASVFYEGEQMERTDYAIGFDDAGQFVGSGIHVAAEAGDGEKVAQVGR